MARRGGLGKGLGALIPPGGAEPAHVAAVTGGLQEITISSIRPNQFQPRRHFVGIGVGGGVDTDLFSPGQERRHQTAWPVRR